MTIQDRQGLAPLSEPPRPVSRGDRSTPSGFGDVESVAPSVTADTSECQHVNDSPSPPGMYPTNPDTNPTLVNLTPHPVTIRDVQIPPSAHLARCVEAAPNHNERVEWLIVNGHPIPLITDRLTTAVNGLPPSKPGVLLIVSRLVALAENNRTDIVYPHTPIRDHTGRIVGCAALAHQPH